GMDVKEGGCFREQDNELSPKVVVIDEALAGKYFPSADPVGKRLNLEGDQWQIIGVVGHVKQWSLGWDDAETLQAQLYQPFRQLSGQPRAVDVVMRVEGGAGKAGTALPVTFDSIRHIVQSQNSQNVIFRLQTMNEVIAATLTQQRFSMILLDAFAAVALLLASVGLYGVISYLVGQRTHELGVRIALGAARKNIIRLVVNHGMKMALGGVGIGLAVALG